ncbi:TPA: hypothetical protein ACKRHU_001131 [Proteus mirabilis]
MSTIPTQNPVPSEAPRDLKYNSGKIDEFVTSMKNKYIDRFGQEHFTIEGLRWVAQQAISQFGYITLDSFQKGAEITLPNQVLRDEITGEYYRWDGALPKSVPVNSTPDNSGGVGVNSWLSVGDAVLRSDLEKGRFNNEGTSIFFIPGINLLDENIDNRAAIYEFNGNVFIPKGITVRCNLLPEDDVTIFKGEGKILTRDPWGNEHIFDVYKANNGSDFSFSDILNQGMYKEFDISVGCIGDSISDGAWGKQDWKSPPTDSNGNLSSVNYNHSAPESGGSHSWVAHFAYGLNLIAERVTSKKIFHPCNCSLSGQKLINGWAYRNFDYGFFKNKAYGNKAPDVLIISMGWNDNVGDFSDYLRSFDSLIKKACGYGSSVSIVSVNQNDFKHTALENSVKSSLPIYYKNIEYYDLSGYLEKVSTSKIGDPNRFYTKNNGVFDVVHPQPIGQITIGSGLLCSLFRNKFIKDVGDNVLLQPSTNDKYVSCVGYTTGNRYSPKYYNAGGNNLLDSMGKIAQFDIDKENVTINYLVYCEDDNLSASIIEPYNRAEDYEVFPAANNISLFRGLGVYPNSEKELATYRTINREIIASGRMRDRLSLITNIGKLHYGLNLISIIYGGNPSIVYPPLLKFQKNNDVGSMYYNFSFIVKNNIYGSIKKLINNPDRQLVNIFDGSVSSFTPHFFISGDFRVSTTIIHSDIPSGFFVLLNYDEINDIGISISVNDGVIEHGEYSKGNVENINKTNINKNGEIRILSYQATSLGKVSNNFKIDCGGNSYSFSSEYSTGGTIGAKNSSGENVYLTISTSNIYVN